MVDRMRTTRREFLKAAASAVAMPYLVAGSALGAGGAVPPSERVNMGFVGLGGQDEEWLSGRAMAGVWYATVEDAGAHQRAMHTVPVGRFQALAVSPLSSGRLASPMIALFYATPGAMIYFINGLQWAGYKRFDWSVVGESSCADSWGRALSTGEPSLSIPCFAERRYGGVLDDEMLMALPPPMLGKAIDGMKALAANGFRYPFATWGIQQDVRAGMAISYPGSGQ